MTAMVPLNVLMFTLCRRVTRVFKNNTDFFVCMKKSKLHIVVGMKECCHNSHIILHKKILEFLQKSHVTF